MPLSIGVTGHRDLVPDELPAIRGRVTRFLLDLQEQFPDRPLRVLSPLAEGADQLVAEVALELGLTLMVPMPMKRELYSIDFKTDEQRARFAKLYKQASEVFELPAVITSYSIHYTKLYELRCGHRARQSALGRKTQRRGCRAAC